MRATGLIALVVCAACNVCAFKDTVPFLLFSSEAPPSPLHDVFTSPRPSLQRLEPLLSTASNFVRNIDLDLVVVLSSAKHVDRRTLTMALESQGVQSKLSVPEVVGATMTSADELGRTLAHTLPKAEILNGDGAVVLVRHEDARASLLKWGLGGWIRADGERLGHIDLTQLASSEARYSVIFIGEKASQDSTVSSSGEHMEYAWQEEFTSTSHLDLKRDVSGGEYSRDSDHTGGNVTDDRGLFEKYSFFTPGIFMGLATTFIMLLIGSVGLNAVSSLKVSYAAFDKENGPHGGSSTGAALTKR